MHRPDEALTKLVINRLSPGGWHDQNQMIQWRTFDQPRSMFGGNMFCQLAPIIEARALHLQAA